MKKKKNKKINYKQKRKLFLDTFSNIINNNKNDLPIFSHDTFYRNIKVKTNSWFDINKYIKNEKTTHTIVNNDKLDVANYRQIKVKMILNETHKKILQKWFKTTTYMYNETLNYIRQNYIFTKKEITTNILKIEAKNNNTFYNKRYIRDKLNKLKKDIQKDNIILIDKNDTLNKQTNIKCIIDIHTLDKTIYQLVQNINSAVTNMFRGNIKRFRLKFWKYNRPSQTIELEKGKIKDGILCKSIFENLEPIKYIYDNENYDISQIDSDFKINYNDITKEYHLLVSEKISQNTLEDKKNIIVLDPGLRTFMTGLSNNEHVNIGTNVHKTIKDKIKRLNKIKKNKNIPIKIKKKNEKLINKKINNKINELHWKTINYLINGYSTIFLGDMSAKSIVKKENSVLSNESKVACLRTKYYEFNTRLKYKCSVNKRNFKLINEYYTSKTCSLCCNYNEKLEGNKMYNCQKCKATIDRDINGCRNIYMKQFIKNDTV